MPIEFRCTRCRAKLHVPTRWGGTTVPCPKCQTRVVVPGVERGAANPKMTFETREVEKSIAALEAAPGGSFADPGFRLPDTLDAAGAANAEDAAVAIPAGVTLPSWVIYALVILVPAVGIVSFLLGAAFGGPWIGLARH
jgi:DNA-directed RNA polymerase subunit RPC12/RpoP